VTDRSLRSRKIDSLTRIKEGPCAIGGPYHDFSFVWSNDPGDAIQQGALAGAGAAKQDGDTRTNLQFNLQLKRVSSSVLFKYASAQAERRKYSFRADIVHRSRTSERALQKEGERRLSA